MPTKRTIRQLERDIYIGMLTTAASVARELTDEPVEDWMAPQMIVALRQPVSLAAAYADLLTSLKLELPPPISQALEIGSDWSGPADPIAYD